jgi:hypothetical protein
LICNDITTARVVVATMQCNFCSTSITNPAGPVTPPEGPAEPAPGSAEWVKEGEQPGGAAAGGVAVRDTATVKEPDQGNMHIGEPGCLLVVSLECLANFVAGSL